MLLQVIQNLHQPKHLLHSVNFLGSEFEEVLKTVPLLVVNVNRQLRVLVLIILILRPQVLFVLRE